MSLLDLLSPQIDLLTSPLASRIGLALVHSIWQGALVAAGLALALRLIRRATFRYAAACIALLLVLLMPALTFLYSAYSPTGQAVYIVEPSEGGGVPLPTADAMHGGPSVTLFLPAGWIERWLPWAVALWALGVLALSLRLATGIITTARLRRSAMPGAEWLSGLVDTLAARMGVGQRVAVAISTCVTGPVVLGWLQPIVLLPLSALTGLTPAQLEAILAHELAHVRRHDYIVNIAQSVAETLLFYHPLVWWIGGRIRAEREDCCDDAAVTACGDVLIYARALSTLERLRPAPRLALGASGGSLVGRIHRLIGAPVAAPALAPARTVGSLVATVVVAVLLLGVGRPSPAIQVTPSTAQAELEDRDLVVIATSEVAPRAGSATAPPLAVPAVAAADTTLPAETLAAKAEGRDVTDTTGLHLTAFLPSRLVPLHRDSVDRLAGIPKQPQGASAPRGDQPTGAPVRLRLVIEQPLAGVPARPSRVYQGTARGASDRIRFSTNLDSVEIRTRRTSPIKQDGQGDGFVDDAYCPQDEVGLSEGWFGDGEGYPASRGQFSRRLIPTPKGN